MYEQALDLDGVREFMLREYNTVYARIGMYELQYYNLYGELPKNALVIQEVLWAGDNPMLVYHDVRARSD